MWINFFFIQFENPAWLAELLFEISEGCYIMY